jgi:hypothetical protein
VREQLEKCDCCSAVVFLWLDFLGMTEMGVGGGLGSSFFGKNRLCRGVNEKIWLSHAIHYDKKVAFLWTN